MSIIIYHNEPQIDPKQVKALAKFYGCEHAIEDHDYGSDIPESTLIVMKQKPGVELLSVHPDMRKIHINTAFSEMATHISKMIDVIEPGSDSCDAKLREFLAHQHGEIFTMHDVIMFLEMNPDSDGVFYKIPAITKSLEQLGCSKEHMTVFTPPPAPQQIKQRFVSRDEIVT